MKNKSIKTERLNHLFQGLICRDLVFASLIIFTIFTLSTSLALASGNPKLEQQRKLYASAEQALRVGNIKSFKQLKSKLTDYPLYPYLEFKQIKRRIAYVKPDDIVAFLEKYEDTALGERLRRQWLFHLAKRKRWTQFIRFYQDTGYTTLQCHYANALHHTGQHAQALELTRELWLVGKSQPRACDPVFLAWRQAGHLSETLIWERFALAMQENRSTLARYLTKLLPEASRPTAKLWLRVHRHPALVMETQRFQREHPYTAQILAHGVKRLIRKDLQLAKKAWNKILFNYTIPAGLYARTEREIGLILATRLEPDAYTWLRGLNLPESDRSAITWRLRALVTRQDWPTLRRELDKTPGNIVGSEKWQYWRARALAETNEIAKAEVIFKQLAQKRDYYGFLAADRLNAPYALEDEPLIYTTEELNKLKHKAGLQRAHELLILKKLPDARREWRYEISQLTSNQKKVAAKLAQNWEWHDQAILTIAKTDHRDDVDMRFPLAFRTPVVNYAKKHHLDPAWAYAMIRQESAFATDARSPRGALGLMQLLPRTGKKVGKNLNRPIRHNYQLLHADTNILFGLSYLRQVLDQFDQNPILATAAYNAGPHRVKTWLESRRINETDIWIETIPYKETRNYVQNILAYTAIYARRLGRDSLRLAELMKPIPTTAGLTQKDKKES